MSHAFRIGLWACGLLCLAGLGLFLGMAVGSQGLEPWFARHNDEVMRQIVLEIRAPRTLGAWLGGALLGLAGAIAQGFFRNPLADPFLLGSASGASLGVSLWLSLGGGTVMTVSLMSRLGLTSAAFAGACLAVLLTLFLSRGVLHTLRLLLAGVVVGVVLGAVSSLVALLEPSVLQALQGFMLGSTAFVGWTACLLMGLALALCLGLAISQSRVLDALTLGESTARSLGAPMTAARLILVGALSLATATAVAQLGLIAFVGLAAPHLVRSLLRSTHAALLLLSALMGGLLLQVADLLARLVVSPQELPVGVLTGVLGGFYLLWRLQPGRESRP
jgi:iron complex transport system permease protein